eukprot:1840513-Ditylum_brightwellii.AAC.1
MLSAEKQCCRRHQGHAWSVKLVKTARKDRYWKQQRSCLLNGRTVENTLIQFAQENAASLRDEFLEELAQLYITNKNTNIASIIKN